MDGVSAAVSIIALIKILLKVVSLCAEYYSHVKNTKKDTNRFCLEVKAFINILRNLNRLARGLGVLRLFALRSLNDEI